MWHSRLNGLYNSGAPNDGFLLNTLKYFLGCPEYFKISRNYILRSAKKFVSENRKQLLGAPDNWQLTGERTKALECELTSRYLDAGLDCGTMPLI